MAGAAATTLGRARITGLRRSDDRLAVRLALASSLASADLQPTGLPPAAVLIVSQLAAPGDRALPIRPGARVDPGWERAARAALTDLYRRALRPMDQAVPPGCQAVLFRDETELLACLAQDISLGRAGERWWWQTYRRRRDGLGRDTLPSVLLEEARWVPAALRLLHRRGQAEPVLQALTPAASRQVLRAICQAFDVALPSLTASWPSQAGAQPASGGESNAAAGAPVANQAPWRAWLAEDGAALPPESVCLLGVALTLAHAPSVAQSSRFVAAVERWWQQETAQPSRLLAPAPVENLPRRRRPDGLSTSAATAAQGLPVAEARDMGSPPAAVASLAATELPAQPGQAAPGARPEAHSRPDAASLPPPAGIYQAPPDRVAEQRVALEPGELVAVAPMVAGDFTDGVQTELGGVLFLLNVMQRLDLPGCFEADWRLASQVGPWGVLDLLARGLLSELPTSPKVGNSDSLAADPLWAALAALDDRAPGELPGAHFVGQGSSLAMPAAWGRWLDPASLDQASDPVAVTPLDGPRLAGVSRDLRTWLAWVTPLLRAMLSRALGEARDLFTGLLLRRGRLYVTSSHVDLVLPLESVALPVRVAGLDFDPGWLPAFGRVVQFHYE